MTPPCPQVYNCTSGGDNPITWTNIGELCKASARKAAYEGALWSVHVITVQCFFLFTRFKRLLQVPVWEGEGELVREHRLPDGLLLRPSTGGGPGLQDCRQETLPDKVCPVWQESSSNFLSRAYAMLMKSCVALEPFTTQSWTWSTTNVLGLEVCPTYMKLIS